MEGEYNKESLKSLMAHPGWVELMRMYQDKFEQEYRRLRKIKTRSDITFGNRLGWLDALEWAQRCVPTIVNEPVVDDNPQEGPSEGE